VAEKHVGFERDGDVGVVVVASPPLNLWTPELQADLEAALDEAESEKVRALVIRAEGRPSRAAWMYIISREKRPIRPTRSSRA
jgi:enoyl-CoA hydratase/carnithine racemase